MDKQNKSDLLWPIGKYNGDVLGFSDYIHTMQRTVINQDNVRRIAIEEAAEKLAWTQEKIDLTISQRVIYQKVFNGEIITCMQLNEMVNPRVSVADHELRCLIKSSLTDSVFKSTFNRMLSSYESVKDMMDELKSAYGIPLETDFLNITNSCITKLTSRNYKDFAEFMKDCIKNVEKLNQFGREVFDQPELQLISDELLYVVIKSNLPSDAW